MREESEKVKRKLLKKKLRQKGGREKEGEKTSQREKRRYALVPSYVDINGEKIVHVRTNSRNNFLKQFQN